MIARTLSWPLLLTSAIGFAQVNPSVTMTNALTWVGSQPIVYVQMIGTQTNGTSVRNLDYECYATRFKIGPQGKPVPTLAASMYVDIEAYIQNNNAYIPISRTVADGSVLWKYNYPNVPIGGNGAPNSYTSFNYMNSAGAAPADTLLNALSGLTDSFADQAALLFKQAFSTTAPTFQPWLGGSTLDPKSTINQLIYNATGSQLTYNISYDIDGNTELNSVTFSSNQNLGGQPVTTQWTMTILPLTTVSPLKFAFTPPAGALPVATSHVKGG